VSLRELHARTGSITRAAANRRLQVTDRGRVLGVIHAPGVAALRGVPLPQREKWIARLPRQRGDSAALISEDRDRGCSILIPFTPTAGNCSTPLASSDCTSMSRRD